MAKVVEDFGEVTCIGAELHPEVAAVQSNSRRYYVGETGRLMLMESEKKYPGQQFLIFGETDLVGPNHWTFQPWYLKTSYGQLERKGKQLIFVTQNTRYVFEMKE